MSHSSVYQASALWLVYSKLITLVVVPISQFFALPILLYTVLFFLRSVSGGYLGVSLSLYLVEAVVTVYYVRQFSENDAQFLKSLRNFLLTWWRGGSLAVLPPCLVRVVLAPIFQSFGVAKPSFGDWFVFVSFPQLIVISAITLLLGLSVCARFVGKVSVVRCSTVPLAVNPIYNRLKNLSFNEISSFALGIFVPLDSPVHMINADLPTHPRRYQSPGFAPCLYLLLMHAAVGVFIALSLNFTCFHYKQDTKGGSLIYIVTILSVFVSLCRTLLQHEIDPKKYLMIAATTNTTTTWRDQVEKVTDAVKSCGFIMIAGLLITRSIPSSSDISWDQHIRRLLGLTVACLAILLFTYFMDDAIRENMFHPLEDIQARVSSIRYDGTSKPIVETIMASILRYSPTHAHTVLQINDKELREGGPGRMDQQELTRTIVWAKAVARSMIGYEDEGRPEACFEEDILQLTVLATLANDASVVDKLIEESRENPQVIASIVRALSVFLFAFVQVLSDCAGNTLTLPESLRDPASNTKRKSSFAPTQQAESWLFPPSLVFAVELALKALSRCIRSACYATKPSPQTIKDGNINWQSSSLSLVVPTSVEAIYAVRLTVSDYQELPSIVSASDEAAAAVLKQLAPVSPLKPDTLQWAHQVKSAIPMKTD